MKALIVSILLALAAGGAYLLLRSPDSESNPGSGAMSRGGPPGARAVAVRAVAARMGEVTERIEAVGTATANESVTITAKVTDTVRAVDFEDGQLVDEGDVLVQLTNAEEAALLAEARANLDDAKRQLQRSRNLGQQGLVAKSSVDEAQARVDALDARLDTIVARLDDRLIRAPFAGVLGFRQVSPGTLVTPTTPIATLDDISLIKLDFTVPEVSLSRIAKGGIVVAQSASWPGREFSGTVQTVGSRIDPITRAVSVRATVPNRDGALRPGMLLSVRLEAEKRTAILVPERSIDGVRGETYVYLLKNNVAERLPVRLGLRRDGVVEVLAGLSAGDLIVSEGLVKLRDGATVRVLDQPGAVAGSIPGGGGAVSGE